MGWECAGGRRWGAFLIGSLRWSCPVAREFARWPGCEGAEYVVAGGWRAGKIPNEWRASAARFPARHQSLTRAARWANPAASQTAADAATAAGWGDLGLNTMLGSVVFLNRHKLFYNKHLRLF